MIFKPENTKLHTNYEIYIYINGLKGCKNSLSWPFMGIYGDFLEKTLIENFSKSTQ